MARLNLVPCVPVSGADLRKRRSCVSEMLPADLKKAAHERRLRVAIDGPASAGKSTVGKRLAAILNCPYLDTGLMYRAVTEAGLRQGIRLDDAVGLAQLAASMRFEVAPDNTLVIDDRTAGDELRTPDVDRAVSMVSSHSPVRDVLVGRQRALADHRCFVMVGRDISSIVLPDAPVKIWITASPEVRAHRRLGELLAAGTLPELANELRRRDAIDSTRAVSPSVPAPEATIISTDTLDVDGAVQAVLRLICQALDLPA